MIYVRICKNVGDSFGFGCMNNVDRNGIIERFVEYKIFVIRRFLSYRLYKGFYFMIFIFKFCIKFYFL